MLYQETYHAGGDPHKLNVSGVIYMHDFTPPTLDSDPGLAFPSHCHLFYEIDYTLAGTCQFEFDGRLVNAMPGSLIFHPPLSVHSIRNDKRRGHLILQFSHKLLSLLDNSQEGVLLPAGELQQQGIIQLREGSAAWECMQKLLADVPCFSLPAPAGTNEITEYPFSENLRLNARTLSLLSCLFDDGLIRPEYTDTLPVCLEEMQVLINRLVTHPEEKLSMEEAAACTHMSYSNFCRSFKLILGCSYVDFCNMIRVRRAQELLQNSRKSVTEISALLNFGSVSYFNRIFKKITGCTPLGYRASRCCVAK